MLCSWQPACQLQRRTMTAFASNNAPLPLAETFRGSTIVEHSNCGAASVLSSRHNMGSARPMCFALGAHDTEQCMWWQSLGTACQCHTKYGGELSLDQSVSR
jgi:hypothetical protein